MPDISERQAQELACRQGYEDGQRAAFKQAYLDAHLEGSRKGLTKGHRAGFADGFEQACRAMVKLRSAPVCQDEAVFGITTWPRDWLPAPNP